MKRPFTVVAILCFSISILGQSIRKNYIEMTTSERDALVGAFYQLRSGADLINDLANFHNDNFNFDNTSDPTQLDIHFNLPEEPERQIFFSWHRQQVFEVEQAMQDINPNISVPWWDSSVDQSVSSLLWSQEFMGQFDVAWGLGRNLGVMNMLPTSEQVASTQAITDFLLYSDTIERSSVHHGAHHWVGGVMESGLSPRDPAFYLHHTFIDKLWDDWAIANPGESSHIITSMIRYDGTYVFDGQTLPLIDPDSIVDSKVLGVFYAENQLAELFDYTVSNTYSSLENFYYQYRIVAGNNFIVPATTNCNIESVSDILLVPGFSAASGSMFTAKIDVDNDISTMAENLVVAVTLSNHNPFDYNPDILNVNAYNPVDSMADQMEVTIFPNPFTDRIFITMNKTPRECVVRLYNILGELVSQHNISNQSDVVISNLGNLNSGVYILEIHTEYGIVLREKIIKK